MQPTFSDQASLERVRHLQAALDNKVLYRQLLRTRGTDAQNLLDFFQSLLDTSDLDATFRRRLVIAMQRLSKKSGLYPVCYELRGVELENEYPVTAGGFADIYRGVFEGQVVCLKTIRVYQDTQLEHFLKQFSKEVILWAQLTHANILPTYGLYRFRNRICLVAPWIQNGDIGVYLKRNPTVNRISLASDVAQGLLYLHENHIIHGDLKGPNILVDDAGRARLCDFGISCISDPEIVAWTSQSSMSSHGGSLRWQAPELFDLNDDEPVKNTIASDVYAFACVCYEIYTNNVPFYHISRDAAVMLQIKLGKRPLRPPQQSSAWLEWGLTEDIWLLLHDCWKEDITHRPSVETVIKRLQLQSLNKVIDYLGVERLLSPVGAVPAGHRSIAGAAQQALPVGGTPHVSTICFRRRMSEPLDAASIPILDRLLHDGTPGTPRELAKTLTRHLGAPIPQNVTTHTPIQSSQFGLLVPRAPGGHYQYLHTWTA